MKWEKGKSGNPGGRPKAYRDVVEAARKRTIKAIKTLESVMTTSDNDSARVKAAEVLLDRGWGKPVQPVDLDPHNRQELERRAREILARRAAEAEGEKAH